MRPDLSRRGGLVRGRRYMEKCARVARSLDLCVVGAGYVGLVTGACLADVGHRVVCVDSDPAKLKSLKAGRVPIHEPGLEEIFRRVTRSGRLAFAASVEEGLRHKGRRAQVV